MPVENKAFLYIRILLVCLALTLTACLPKDLLRVSSEQAHQEAVETVDSIDSELAIDRELAMASHSPSSIVGSSNVSVAELSSHDAVFGESLELSEEEFFDIPAGLLMLEGPDAYESPQYFSSTGRKSDKTPPLGSAEARALAAINTKQALCRPGDKVCVTSPYGVRRGKRVHKG
ncbi:MAG: hypothetical protein IJ034_05430, partial [Mailhella sp.]|nr:hypothetical protein [Mailhella sp.]